MAKNEEKQISCCCFSKKDKPIQVKEVKQSECSENSGLNNKVPFSADLPKDLDVGKVILLKGIILPNCSRFSVNLTCGRSPTSDIAFHFNPRLQQRYVVRNSRLNGHWGEEETATPIKFDFKPNKKFNLDIFIGEGEFLVSLDGVHLCSYQFRIALNKVTGIDVQGGVDVCGVEYKNLDIYPEPIPENKPLTVAPGRKQGHTDVPETPMDTPVTFLLPEGFQRDWQLEIYGRVKILPHSFYINLQEGSHQWPHPVIPLHLNPRFSMGTGEPIFVRNAWIDGGWGQEERTPGFQFSPGSPFTMAIRRGDDHFSVWIDGKLAGEFKFRGPVDKIDTVHIQGDLVVFAVTLDEKSDILPHTIVQT